MKTPVKFTVTFDDGSTEEFLSHDDYVSASLGMSTTTTLPAPSVLSDAGDVPTEVHAAPEESSEAPAGDAPAPAEDTQQDAA